MAQTVLEWNQTYFNRLLKRAGIEELTGDIARAVASEARMTAPVASGAYRDGIKVEVEETPYRKIFKVVATAPHSMKVESRTGNLARALKTVRR